MKLSQLSTSLYKIIILYRQHYKEFKRHVEVLSRNQRNEKKEQGRDG